MEEEQPQREILWEEQRGVITLRAIREGAFVRIEATAVYHAVKTLTHRELDALTFDPIPDIKTQLVHQIAQAGKQLYLDVNS